MTDPTVVHAEDVLPVRSRISWGAVFAGAFFAFAIYFVLTLLSAAIGLSIQDRVRPENLGIGAAIVAIVTLGASLFLGGYVTSLTAVGENLCEAGIHAVLMWCILFAGLVALAGSTVSMGFSAMVGMAQVGQAAADRVNAQGWEETARQAGVPQDRIEEWRRQARAAANNAEEAVNNPQNREDARQAGTAVAWWTLFGTVLSMICAIAGSMVGAGPSPQLAALISRTRVVRHDVTMPRT